MKENGAESEIISFLDNNAALSTCYNDDIFCQEILFPYNASFYAVAIRGGTQDDFGEITDTIRLIENADNVASK